MRVVNSRAVVHPRPSVMMRRVYPLDSPFLIFPIDAEGTICPLMHSNPHSIQHCIHKHPLIRQMQCYNPDITMNATSAHVNEQACCAMRSVRLTQEIGKGFPKTGHPRPRRPDSGNCVRPAAARSTLHLTLESTCAVVNFNNRRIELQYPSFAYGSDAVHTPHNSVGGSLFE